MLLYSMVEYFLEERVAVFCADRDSLHDYIWSATDRVDQTGEVVGVRFVGVHLRARYCGKHRGDVADVRSDIEDEGAWFGQRCQHHELGPLAAQQLQQASHPVSRDQEALVTQRSDETGLDQ